MHVARMDLVTYHIAKCSDSSVYFQTKLGLPFPQNLSHQFWMNVRARYTKSSDLVAAIDKNIAHIILLSYSNNLFLTCKQLFETMM